MPFYIIVKIVENLSYWEKRKEKIEHTQEINKVWSFFFFFEWIILFKEKATTNQQGTQPSSW